MQFDVYQPCPCGSGKKLKFCCQGIAEEIGRFVKLQQSNQYAMAQQVLEGLEEQHPNNPWVVTTHASVLLGERKTEEARDLLAKLLEEQADHPLALVLYATARFSLDGYGGSKNDIHRAFQKSMAAHPDMVSGLALGIAGAMYASSRYIATRQHLALAMRLAPDEQQQDIFLRLLEFDSDQSIPYPLRSVHDFVDYEGSEKTKDDVAKAMRFASIGCWGPAATVLTQVAEHDADSAALWQNIGLCRAWDGNEAKAAEAFHKAAALHGDFETSVELETVAQLLADNTAEDRVYVRSIDYEIDSASQLLSKLDGQDRLPRVEFPESASREDLPAGLFEVLDHAVPEGDLTLDNVPNVLAQLTVYDADPSGDPPARAHLTGFDNEGFAQAKQLIHDVVGADIREAEAQDDDDDDPLESLPTEWYPLHWRWYVPPKTPGNLRRSLERAQWQRKVDETWTNLELSSLGGRTPLAASEDPEARVALAAAVHVLESFCNRNEHPLDVAAVRARLNLDQPALIEIDDETPLNTFSVMQTNRVPVDKLSDDQLGYVLNRALLVHHGRYLYDVLVEALKRPACLEKIDTDRVYSTLVDLAMKRSDSASALEWVVQARNAAKSDENAFQAELQWSLRELALRLDDPTDDAIPALIDRLWNYYGTKLPQLRVHLTSLLEMHGLESPAIESVAAADGGGLWTPGAPEPETDGGEKKLWVPGQS